VLACACGTVLDADDMHRAPTLLDTPEATSGARVARIVCRDCALPPTVAAEG
jgi:hypothetical protein